MKKPQKKPASKKKAPAKRSKIKTDALRAFQLVCILIIVSICISFAIIIVRNNVMQGSGREQGAIVPSERSNEQGAIVPSERSSEQGAVAPSVQSNEQAVVAPIEPAPEPKPEPAPAPAPAIALGTGKIVSAPTGSIAFVIDDAGNNLQELEAFLRIDGPLTIAVLPGLPHSREAARRIRVSGKEVILHQPMEALGGQNPGPSAIYSNMSKEKIIETLKKNIEEVGPVAGINNHQGSKITQDKDIMEVILAFCAENNIYFLDSRTTAETAAPGAARRLGMKIAERDIFLDNEQDKESMQRYLASGLTRAQRNGTAVMIGHVQSKALAPLLAEQYPDLTIQGYTIKTVGELLK